MIIFQVVELMDAGERVMKFVTVTSLIGLNALFIGTITVCIKLVGKIRAHQVNKKCRKKTYFLRIENLT